MTRLARQDDETGALVRLGGAAAEGAGGAAERAEYGLPIGATNHLALLNHPPVYEKLREWLR